MTSTMSRRRNPRGDRLRAAVASGVAVSIALSGGVAEPDDHVTVEQQIDAERLAEMFSRHLAPDEVAVAQAMLAGPMSWAADPSLHREFIGAELHAWMTARAGGGITSNPYLMDQSDKHLRTAWAAAFARAQAAQARARQAATPTPISRTLRFWDAKDGKTIGTVTLTPAGELAYSDDDMPVFLQSRVRRLGPEQAFLDFVDYSNGYWVSSEV